MSRLFNVLIAINVLLPWIASLLLPIDSSVFLNELLFFGCVFVMAVGNARIARLMPEYWRWIWALSIANLICAALIGQVALATSLPILLGLLTG